VIVCSPHGAKRNAGFPDCALARSIRATLFELLRIMKPLPKSDDVLNVARNVIWFEPPECALAKPIRFLAYLMTYGTADEVATVMRYVSVEDFREALEHAPPGIFDKRSWNYWHLMMDRYPPPPMPTRIIPDEV